jgi:hypothetical protein
VEISGATVAICAVAGAVVVGRAADCDSDSVGALGGAANFTTAVDCKA